MTPAEQAKELQRRAEEMHRLRMVDGLSLREIAGTLHISAERVRQILRRRFGVTGEPPAVKTRRAVRRTSGTWNGDR